MEVVWSDFALESLFNIAEYVQLFFNKEVADDVIKKIIAYTDKLSHSPKMGKQMTHLSDYGEIRCAFYKMNHIYYQIFEERIEVILVWDGRQDPNRVRTLLKSYLS